jgi:hypothetical protein
VGEDIHTERAGNGRHAAQHDRELTVTEGLRDRDIRAGGRAIGERGCDPSPREQSTQPRDEGQAEANDMPGISHAAIVETGTYEIITSSGDFVSLAGVMPGSGNTRIMPGSGSGLSPAGRGCR